MDWQRILYSVPAVILGLTVHEFCHAWAAHKLGDDTAKEQGRVSFNPLRHIDPIGLAFIVFAGFGWAKPVQFSLERLGSPRRDKALIAASGPLSNLLVGILLTLIIRLLLRTEFGGNSIAYVHLFLFLYYAASINLGLFVFNILPIPPLDGSHIFFSGLNLSPETEYRIMRIGAPLLFILIIVSNSTGIDILPIGKAVGAIMRLFL
ncbi:site-2 protease family protein [Treponema sp. OttesenSCG-928-L16]|nr:site-2 protease family protein [Treponema sp. OttesenSCG-928-L16]